MNTPHILISGGGIGGLSAGLALVRSGFKVDIFEKTKVWGEIGAGIQLSPNAMHILQALGLSEPILKAGFEPEHAVMRGFKTGAIKLSTALKSKHHTRYGAPYIHIHRADLHDILRRAAQQFGVTIHTGTTVISYRQNADRLSVTTSKGVFDGDALIGADGIHSDIRRHMTGENHPRFTGHVAWRGLVDIKKLHGQRPTPDANIWMGPGRHFVSYYVRGGAWVNFVAIEEREKWAAEDWTQTGDIDKLRRAFKGWDAPVRALLEASETCFLWGLFEHPVRKVWVDNRVALLGDAAHAMLPFMAQGAAMAIEDAWVLAYHINAQPHNIPSALKSYQSLRVPRTTRLQNTSKSNAEFYHKQGGAGRTIRDIKLGMASRLPALANMKFDPIYGFNAPHALPIGMKNTNE